MERKLQVIVFENFVDYLTAWRYQHALSEFLNDSRKTGSPQLCGYLLLLAHQSVYTLGRNGNIKNLGKLDKNDQLYRVERGGDITWHGEGQLTVYPILDLNYFKKDLHW
jgi:lipoyl(octanoyl) transferase